MRTIARIFGLAGFFIAVELLTIGCRAQIPSNPTIYTCPSAGTYTALNSSSPASGLTYTDSKPAAGVYCYVGQSVNDGVSPRQVSIASNIAGPFTTSGSNSVNLSWGAPTSGTTPTGYVISRAPAIQSTIAPPALGTGAVATVKPALQPTGTEMAKVEDLKGSVR